MAAALHWMAGGTRKEFFLREIGGSLMRLLLLALDFVCRTFF
jgi:hypothetical protein